MADSGRLPLTTVVTVLASILGGGAMGAILNHYWSRQTPAILTYDTSVAVIADTSQTEAVIVPNLHLQIDNKEIKKLFINSVELRPSGDRYADSAEIAITFPSSVQVYAPPVLSVPSPLYHMKCDTVDSGFVCKIWPIKTAPNAQFRVSWASDRYEQMSVETASEDVELQLSDGIRTDWRYVVWEGLSKSSLLFTILAVLLAYLAGRLGDIRTSKKGT